MVGGQRTDRGAEVAAAPSPRRRSRAGGSTPASCRCRHAHMLHRPSDASRHRGARTLRRARRPASGSGRWWSTPVHTIWSNIWPSSSTCFDREAMKLEVSQAVFSLKIARVTQARFADVDCRHLRIRLAQRMDRGLRGAAAGDQDLSICPRLLRRPQQQRQCPTPIRVAIELAVPIEVGDRRRIRVALVKGAHLVGRIGGRWCSRLFPSHVRLFAPWCSGGSEYRICHSRSIAPCRRCRRLEPGQRPPIRVSRVSGECSPAACGARRRG